MKSNKISWSIFLIIILIFTLIQTKGLTNIVPGDETVYLYMGKSITEGKLPYKDFFYAHPPLHIFIIAFLYNIYGFNILTLKLIPFLSIIISAFFLFKLMKEKFGNLEAIVTIILFLSSFLILFNSVYSFGISLTTMFIVIGFYYIYVKKKYLFGGIFFGIGSVTGLQSLVPILVIMLIIFLNNKKHFMNLFLGFLSIFLIVNILLILLYGNDYFSPVYQYHLIKPELKTKLFNFSEIIKLNWLLILSSLLFIFAKDKKIIQMPLFIVAAYLVFLMILSRIFQYYFILLFPFLAIIAGYSLVNISKRVYKPFLIPLIIILSLVFLWNTTSDVMFLTKYGFNKFSALQISDFVRENTDKDVLLFGDASITPLIAILSDRKIAFDLVDTNENVFLTQIVDIKETINKLKMEDVFIIIRTDEGIGQFKEIRDYLNMDCILRKYYEDKIEGGFLIYDCTI
ncbi:MAG: glycosyltransferase family 39 protein [Nanoarchaeota archaeon]|nr:glycosyltransferase family 39 protein [Nanoarchaeota archaeon]